MSLDTASKTTGIESEIGKIKSQIQDQVSCISSLNHRKNVLESFFVCFIGFFLVALTMWNVGSFSGLIYLSLQSILLAKLFYDIRKVKQKINLEKAALTLIQDMRSSMYNNSFVPKYIRES